MKIIWSAFAAGLLFAIGLGVSGMTQPQKVIGFLDLFGNWDPTLLFVMIGAIPVHMIFYRIIRKRSSPLFTLKWNVPERMELTPQLIIGSALFGVGWGLAGYCPGPAIVSLAAFSSEPWLIVSSMFVGWALYRVFEIRFLQKKRGIRGDISARQ